MQENAVDLVGMAEILNVSVDTVRRRANAGEIPGMKLGKMWRFFPTQVIAHLSKPTEPWLRVAGPRRTRRRRSA